jgi:hypothetical protein
MMGNISFRLPEYEVIIHIKVNKFSKNLEREIESLTAEFELEESTGDSAYRDYHWFNTWEEAVSASEHLKRLVTNPNLVLLKVRANYHPEIQPISYKDLRVLNET